MEDNTNIIKDERTSETLRFMLYNHKCLENILSDEDEKALLKAINVFSDREWTTEDIIDEQEK